MKYIYFVAYEHMNSTFNNSNVGNDEVVMDHKVQSIEDVREMENKINSSRYPHVQVKATNFFLLREEE